MISLRVTKRGNYIWPIMLKLKFRSNVFLCASPWHNSIDGNPFKKRKNHVTLNWIWWLNSLKHTFPRNKYTGTIAGKIRAIVPEQLACWLMRMDHWCKLCWFQIDFNIDILNSRFDSISSFMYISHLNCMISTPSHPPEAMSLLLLLLLC